MSLLGRRAKLHESIYLIITITILVNHTPLLAPPIQAAASMGATDERDERKRLRTEY